MIRKEVGYGVVDFFPVVSGNPKERYPGGLSSKALFHSGEGGRWPFHHGRNGVGPGFGGWRVKGPKKGTLAVTIVQTEMVILAAWPWCAISDEGDENDIYGCHGLERIVY